MTKTNSGHFFEDFRLNQVLVHATPRTITEGDVALYQGLFGSRFPLQSSHEFAKSAGFKTSPLDDFLVFHMVFGKSVPDISLNAVANLGYAEGKFLKPVFAGDTVSARSVVIGLKENSSKKTGVVYVKTTGFNQHGEAVLDYIRWVMVNKRDEAAVVPPHVPDFKQALTVQDLPSAFPLQKFDTTLSGSPYLFSDYFVGEKIDHVDGVTVEETEHMMATRLYQNTAKVHFNAQMQSETRFKKRLIYGGHVISLARSLSFNGLANAAQILGLNAGKHINPLFAGDTVYAWSEVLETAKLSATLGALRIRTIATKNHACRDFPSETHENTILSLDYWVSLPL